jgi:hypothetical protein
MSLDDHCFCSDERANTLYLLSCDHYHHRHYYYYCHHYFRRNHKKKKNNQDMFSAKDDGKDTINEVAKEIKPSFWGGVTTMLAEYRTAMLAPAPRRRGAERSDYIAKLLEETKEENTRKK